MNLKTRMIALIGTPVLLVFIVMAGIVYEILMDSMEQEMMEMATHHASDINGQLIGKKEMLAAVTRAWDAKLPSYEDMQTTANYFANKNGIGDFFIGFPNQPFIDGADKTSDPTFDPTGRAWYKDAAGSQDVMISKIYLTKTDHKPVVSFSSAFRQNGQVAGVAGFDLSLDAVKDFVSAIKVGETGGAFLLNEDGGSEIQKHSYIGMMPVCECFSVCSPMAALEQVHHAMGLRDDTDIRNMAKRKTLEYEEVFRRWRGAAAVGRHGLEDEQCFRRSVCNDPCRRHDIVIRRLRGHNDLDVDILCACNRKKACMRIPDGHGQNIRQLDIHANKVDTINALSKCFVKGAVRLEEDRQRNTCSEFPNKGHMQQRFPACHTERVVRNISHDARDDLRRTLRRERVLIGDERM